MSDRRQFCVRLIGGNLSEIENAIGLLWFYRQTQEFENRTAAELAADLHEEGLARPNVTRLHERLAKSPLTTKGRRAKSFQINARKIDDIEKKFSPFLKVRTSPITNSVVPYDWVKGTRKYLESLVHQINSCFDLAHYDAAAVLCRRLMESLLIECYIHSNRKQVIQDAAGHFFMLEKLISTIAADRAITLGRNSVRTMVEVKEIGDRAAHDRTYTTQHEDLSGLASRYRGLISELLRLAGIRS